MTTRPHFQCLASRLSSGIVCRAIHIGSHCVFIQWGYSGISNLGEYLSEVEHMSKLEKPCSIQYQGCRFVPYTFLETKPQMVPMDLNIGFQCLALIQGQIYNPEYEFRRSVKELERAPAARRACVPQKCHLCIALDHSTSC